MKKRFLVVLIVVLVSHMFGLAASAAVQPPSFVSVVLDGKKMVFPDEQAFLDENGRTLVPVRFVAEALGAIVGWEPDTLSVPIEKAGKHIHLTIGASTAVVDGNEVAFDTKAVMHNERTFVPLRFVSEILGVRVEWDGDISTVFLFTTDTQSGKTDSWGRLVRTTDLPDNAADYPYILADVPNEMYEMKYPPSHPDASRRSISAQLYTDWPEFGKSNVDLWMNRLKSFGALWLNVDYRTIDDSWAEQLAQYQSNGNVGKLKAAKEYVNWVKENEVVAEGYLDPEPSMIYRDGLGNYNVRSRFRVRFSHFKEHKTLLYDAWFPGSMKLQNDEWVPNDTPFEKGAWYEGYSDVALNTNVGGNWGTTLAVSANASLFLNIEIRKAE